MSYSEQFPLVGDDEKILELPPMMDLYDDGDLITNIHGTYQERSYLQESSFARSQAPSPSRPAYENPSQQLAKRPARVDRPQELSSGQLAREQAREDLKRKRSAAYLSQKKPFQSKQLPTPKPNQRDVDRAKVGTLTAAADRLRQSDYILVDSLPSYRLPDNPPVKEKKNSYDFLRTSQVYNYQENRTKKEKNIARELNLTRFEQRNPL